MAVAMLLSCLVSVVGGAFDAPAGAGSGSGLTISPNPASPGAMMTFSYDCPIYEGNSVTGSYLEIMGPGDNDWAAPVYSETGPNQVAQQVFWMLPISWTPGQTYVSSHCQYGFSDGIELESPAVFAYFTLQGAEESTTTSLSVSPAVSSVFGETVTLTASVTATPNSVPTGSVEFYSGETKLDTATLTNGAATVSTSLLEAGQHALTAVYKGSDGFAASGSTDTPHTVQQAPTMTTLSATPWVSVHGQTVMLNASVTTANSALPGVAVKFSVGSIELMAQTDINGMASTTTTNLSLGHHTVGAMFSGDANHASSNAVPVALSVVKASTTTVVSLAPTSSVSGQAVTLTAAVAPVSPGTGTPGGLVTFTLDDEPVGDPVALSGGSASTQISLPAADTYEIGAVYGGSEYYEPSESAPLSYAVTAAETATVVTSSLPGGSVYGQDVTFTATVAPKAPGSGTPQGVVTFLDGTTPLGAAVTLIDGKASLTTSALAVDTHSITASYSGEPDFKPSVSPALSQVVAKASTVSSVVSSRPDGSVYGQPVTFTATVGPSAPGKGVPGGTVSFLDGGQAIATDVELVNGSAQFTTSALSVKTHSITVSYDGGTSFAGSGSNPAQQVVSKASTTASVSAAPIGGSAYGQDASVTVTVAAVAPGSGTPSGLVSFYEGETVLAADVALSNGQATYTTSSWAVGTHPVTAVYQGDARYEGSSSPPVNHVVSKAATTSSVVSSNPASVYGESVTFTATVAANAPGSGTPGGSVSFFDGVQTLVADVAMVGGKASFTTSTLTVGVHSVSAVYGGDGSFTGSQSSSVNQLVVRAATEVTLTVTPLVSSGGQVTPSQNGGTDSVYGQTVELSADVSVLSPGAGKPAGAVYFYSGESLVGEGTVDSDGKASATTSALAVGRHFLQAVYAGDLGFDDGASSTWAHDVERAATTAVLTSSTAEVPGGEPVAFSVTVSAVAPSGATPAGDVEFYDGSTKLGTGALDGEGKAVLTRSDLSKGPHTVTAAYVGSGEFEGSDAGLVELLVTEQTVLTLILPPAPVVAGTPVTLTAEAAAPGDHPTGVVSFHAGDALLGSAPLVEGTAVLLVPGGFHRGTQTITASYDGDKANLGDSDTADLEVSPIPTVTVLTVKPVIVHDGASVALKATVAPDKAAGTVTFLDGDTVIGTAPLADGIATLTKSLTGIGLHSVTARYDGEGDHAASTSAPGIVTVTKPAIASDKQKAPIGADVVVTGEGYGPGATVELWLHSDPVLLKTVTADALGAFKTTVTLPAGVSGDHTIVATGPAPDGSTLTQNRPITITAPDPATGTAGTGAPGTGTVATSPPADSPTPAPALPGLLPRTGAGILALGGAGAFILTTGVGLREATRRRRRNRPVR